jgi:protein-L-isoaspartate(D-aspartate) O-methyltransferase
MDYAAARHNMVESQIRTNNVTHKKLLDALRMVPRESFVPTELHGVAYVDNPIPLNDERYLMAPLEMARLMQEANPIPSDLALVIGCATGYGAAVMSNLAGAVVGLESNPALASEATEILTELSIDTVAVVVGVLKDGYIDQAPYDVIYFDGAVSKVPESISSQLAEGGRLVCILSGGGIDTAVIISRHKGSLSTRTVFECSSPLLPGFKSDEEFVF